VGTPLQAVDDRSSGRYAHKLASFPTPTDDERVRTTVRGIRRSS
jgi:hypothetical protein